MNIPTVRYHLSFFNEDVSEWQTLQCRQQLRDCLVTASEEFYEKHYKYPMLVMRKGNLELILPKNIGKAIAEGPHI